MAVRIHHMICAGALGVLLGPAAWAGAHPKLLAPDRILGAFSNGQDRVAVVVNLFRPARAFERTEWNSIHSLRTLHAANHITQDAVLQLLTAGEHRIRHRFDNQAGFSCEVTSNALEKLLNHPQVESIEPVYILKMHLTQGVPLINALASRALYPGTNMAIAICDTGIDYTHPRLGGGGFPNSKVIGGYDFGDNDADPMPVGEAHGTACAGIAAGDLGTVGDYIGGVAPGAKLYALKIAPDNSGSATSDAMAAAWDWCVTHKNDDPNNPILVISTSFGGGQYFSACDGSVPSMTTAANNAVAAGITVLASAGNDGYCDSIAWPACISSVIAVGAVYDANFGTYLPCVSSASCAPKTASTGCATGYYATDNTAADKVTSYSNIASFLGVLAPGNRCATLDIVGSTGYSTGDYYDSFGGTSAACPYAAGAVACLQNAAMARLGNYLTPAEVRARLASSGDLVTDTKVAITKPRINLGNAIATLIPAPQIDLISATLVAESCLPTNGVVDPGETITIQFALQNTGTAATTNLVATLLATGGVIAPSVPQTYGALAAGGGLAAQPFTCTATGTCGGTVTAVLQLQDGPADLGTVTFNFTLGVLTTVVATNANASVVTIPASGTKGPATPYPSTVNVTGWSGPVTKVTVRLINLSHTYPDDLDILLVGPTGQKILLMSDCGGGNDLNNVTLTFDSTAATALPNSSQISSGTYRPTDYGTGDTFNSPAPAGPYGTDLTVFNGQSPNGNWSLYVMDDASTDIGSLAGGWQLVITASTNLCCAGGSAADVALTATDAPDPVTVGSNLTYSVTVTNLGPASASSVTVTDALPASVTFVSASPGCTHSAGQVIGNLGTIASGHQSTITITVTPIVDGLLTNTATVSAAEPDPVTANNASTTITTVLSAPLMGVYPDGHIFGTWVTGVTAQTSFVVSNLGATTLTGTASVPAPFAIDAGSPFTVPGFGDATVVVSFTPPAESNYAANVTFTSNGGSSANAVTGTGAIVPSAQFSALPTTGTVPLDVMFTDDSTGTITDRSWSFGDGTSTNVTNPGLTHRYTVAGSKTVRLIVTGPVGVSTNIQTDLIVVLSPPVLSVAPVGHDFGLWATGATAQISFIVSNAGQATLTGDAGVGLPFAIEAGSPFNLTGGATTNVVVSFMPTTVGAFTNVVVFNSNGGTATNTVTGHSAVAPIAAFTASPTTGVVPLLVTFTDASTGTITDWSWSFGDGATTNTTATGLVHTYATPGTNTVELIVTGPLGVSTNASLIIALPWDSVGDGIPDAWRQEFFVVGNSTNGQSCATCDPDGDGFGNLQEYLAGTDPTNSLSALRITAVQLAGPDVLITFLSVLNRFYAVQRSDQPWFVVPTTVTNNVAGSGGLVEVIDPGAAVLSNFFYRVRLLP